MSLFKTPYSTTVGSGLHTKDISLHLRQVLVSDNTISSYSSGNNETQPLLRQITGADPSHATVPVFSHPFEVIGLDKKSYIFIDYRPFVRIDNSNQWEHKVIIKNQVEYNFAKARLLMSKIWMTQSTNSISGLGSLPLGVFSSWVSEAITHRFALDMGDQARIAILAAYYYQTLFFVEEMDDNVKTMFIGNIVRLLKMPADLVFKTLEGVDNFTNIKSFCDVVKTQLNNSRLDDFNEGILITILRGTWFGTAAGEILAIALEHPPTWVSLVYTSLSERTFKNSNIAKTSERYAKGGAGDVFMKSFVALAKSVEID